MSSDDERTGGYEFGKVSELDGVHLRINSNKECG